MNCAIASFRICRIGILCMMTQTLTPEVRQIIERVLQLERDRLDRKKNSPINDDILKIIKEVVT